MTEPPGSTTGRHLVVVVGGGPAGLIAAETLAEAGASVTVYDQRRSVGNKFLLAGRGGLNITHSEPFDEFVCRYAPDRPELVAALRRFGPDDLQAWCAGLGEATFVGTSGRVFPRSFRATPLLRAWLQRLGRQGVRFETRHRFIGWADAGAPRFARADGSEVAVQAGAVIFALGGGSWPRLGSDGSWVPVFGAAGISVEPLTAANCGVEINWSPVMRAKFVGTPLKNATFRVAGVPVRGDVVVTEGGLEGGPIYAHSRRLRHQLAVGANAIIEVDLQPDLTVEAVFKRLVALPSKATMTRRMATVLSPVGVALVRDATGNDLPGDPASLAALLKAVPVEVTGLASIGRAISSAGGVRFEEIDDSFMLRDRPGIFVAGEMLDWEAPTGGYLLQACFSTGIVAAEGALQWLDRPPSGPDAMPGPPGP